MTQPTAAGDSNQELRIYAPPPPEPEPQFESADLLIFYGRGWISRGIELATWGPSHVGIVCDFHGLGKEILVESTTLCNLPCLVAGRPKSGVQFHRVAERLANYDGSIYRMRLLPGWKLDHYQRSRLAKSLWRLREHGYTRIGAGLSAGPPLWKASELFPYPDLGSVFCSELCAHAIMQAGPLPADNPAAYNPASLMRDLRRRCLYGRPERVA
ncbi:MAG: hypothetical protein KGL39_31755 [Patescibacteria group bacterium]|nr:hypothetical protein [Patescibacteria group bacterium]